MSCGQGFRQGRRRLVVRFMISGKAHDLGHPGASDPFLASNVGLTANLAGIELATPLDGIAEQRDDSGRAGRLGSRPFARLRL